MHCIYNASASASIHSEKKNLSNPQECTDNYFWGSYDTLAADADVNSTANGEENRLDVSSSSSYPSVSTNAQIDFPATEIKGVSFADNIFKMRRIAKAVSTQIG